MIPILILAAGSSSRMQGRDKLLETIDRVPLLRRTVNSALGTDHPVYVTLPQQPHRDMLCLRDWISPQFR